MKIQPFDFSVIQAPMLGVTSPEMVAAVSLSGGLGSLPVGGLSPLKTLELIKKTKMLMDGPFAVNLFTNVMPTVDKEVAGTMQHFLQYLGEKYQIPFAFEPLNALKSYSYKDQIEVILSEGVQIVSFTFGILDDETIVRLKENNVLLIGTATCLAEAQLLDDKNIDIIVAQGIEAGGHRGTFLDDFPLPQIGVASLVSQIVKVISKPVIAAGGINDEKSIRSVLSAGAKGIQAGTAFIASEESLASSAYKKMLKQATEANTILTRCFSGRWARSIRNRMIEEFEQSGLPIPEYPIQNILTMPLRTSAKRLDNADFMSLYAGQAGFKARNVSATEICRELILCLKAINRVL